MNAYLSSIPEDDYSTSLRFQARLEQSITEALNALGYYHAKISYTITKDNGELIVNVQPGEPVRVKLMDVVISGEANQDEAFVKLLEKSPLKVGRILNQGEYDSLKSSIRNLALQRGYFNGDFTLSRLEVVPELNEANVRLHYDSGIRYHFGSVEILEVRFGKTVLSLCVHLKLVNLIWFQKLGNTTKTCLIPIGFRQYLLSQI